MKYLRQQIEHVTDRDVQRFLISSWTEMQEENATLRRNDRYMRRAMLAMIVVTLLVLASSARGQVPQPHANDKPTAAKPDVPAAPAGTAAPVPAPDPHQLTDSEKLEFREFQLRSANAQQQLDELELRARDVTQAQQQNNQQMQARADALTKELCTVPQGCTFDYQSLAVRPRPAPPAPQAPAEKK